MRVLETVLAALNEKLGRQYLAEELTSLKVAFALKVTAASSTPVQPSLGPLVRRIEALCELDSQATTRQGEAGCFCDSNGFPAGFFTWGLLDEQVEGGLLKAGVDAVSDVPEQGDRAWVIDAAVGPSGDGLELLDSLRKSKALGFGSIGYQRIARGKRLSKRGVATRLAQVRRDRVEHEPVPLKTFLREAHHLHLVASAFDEFAQIGAAARLLSRTTQIARAPVQFVEARLNLAFLLKQHQLVLDEKGHPDSFVSWFRLSENALQIAKANPQAVLYGLLPPQWNEGDRVVLADVACSTAETAALAANKLLDSQAITREQLGAGFTALHSSVHGDCPSLSLDQTLWAVAASMAPPRQSRQPAALTS